MATPPIDVHFHAEPDVYTRVKQRAADVGESVASEVRRAVRWWLVNVASTGAVPRRTRAPADAPAKKIRVRLQLRQPLHSNLRALADQHQTSQAAIINAALRAWLDRPS